MSAVPSSRIALLGSCFGLALLAAGGCGSSPVTTSSGHWGNQRRWARRHQRQRGKHRQRWDDRNHRHRGRRRHAGFGHWHRGRDGRRHRHRRDHGRRGEDRHRRQSVRHRRCGRRARRLHPGRPEVQQLRRRRRRQPHRLRRSGMRRPPRQRRGPFATGISGDNMDACRQDCFFDGDSGMGNHPLPLAAQMRSAQHRGQLPLRCQLRGLPPDRVLDVGVAVATVHRCLSAIRPERLRLFRVLRHPRRPHDPARRHLHGREVQ